MSCHWGVTSWRHTPLQVNPGNVFIKPLVVDRCYESDALVTFSTPAGIYPSGQETGIELEVTDYTGKPADKFQLTWEARHGLKKLAGGKVRSDKGKAVVMVPLPAMTGTTPVELLVSHPKNLWSRKLSLMTSGDVLGLTFYPEGGSLIGTVPQKMGYYVTAREGVPVEIDADIVNGRGRSSLKQKPLLPVTDYFLFKGEAGEKYALVITSAYGKGQRFDLPATGGTGVALVVQKSDQEMITADLLAAPAAQPRKLSVTATRGLPFCGPPTSKSSPPPVSESLSRNSAAASPSSQSLMTAPNPFLPVLYTFPENKN